MSGWQALADEVARWRDAGRIAELWWRDDDAFDGGPALDRLLAIARDVEMPLALAVVPAQATAALAGRLSEEPAVDVLQHGYAHANHAVAPEKKVELGLQRPAMMVLGELGTGWMALERLFGSRALAVMVPPWNRIAPVLVSTLPEIGYRGLSTFGPRPRVHPVRGLLQVNTHVDLIDWKGGPTFAGEEAALAALVTALARARAGDGEPVGILSHHLAMDAGAWDFLRSLWERMTRLENVRVRSARELFAPEAGRQGGRG
ncbi:MAG: polysaccharide deacetylase [Reyranella sp.]|uniref:polysaccharide deacetylase family protein n=1 Tax=Reyranella sp. TaxID=1929291 RepID=UPI0011F6EDE2|nr:polysaccharide deacetylase family protein [Reyranella sp.]TAJ86403.1 MAG: polysaccharide deacetylase [Reyranella sp.]TBR29015.1 MAG: polysaccharide deacetylase [Reyranella sp.]